MTPNMSSHASTEQGFVSTLDTDSSGAERVKLLDAIDQLRCLDIDNDIPLPQIVVIGDQNAGKSSVLEAISGVRFPTNNVACTRFAIEVILRRSPEVNTHARLVTKDGSDLDTSKFSQTVNDLGTLSKDHISEVVALAAKALDVADSDRFSENVLRIEISGPSQNHLTLIDLPGFFSYTPGETDDRVEAMVQDLAERYMRNEQSIILAVISAGTDFYNQQSLKKVKDIDPLGQRTLGVLTAVDKLDRGSDLQKQFLALARNKLHPLSMGWHLLRNPSYTERTEGKFDRGKMESELFSTVPWSDIDVEHRGARELKAKLSRILMDHVQRQVGEVIRTISQKITENEAGLKQLGPHRETLKERKQYLSDIATKHERLIRAGLEGSYEDPFFAIPHRRLRASVRAKFESFEEGLRLNGHKWDFKTESFSASAAIASDLDRYAIMDGAASTGKPLLITRKQYLQKVDTILRAQRGLELPHAYNPKLAGTLFRDQSSKWGGHAEALTSRIVTIVSNYLRDSISHVADHRRAHLIYQQRLSPALEARETAMKQKLAELMLPLARAPMTYNGAYSARVKELLRASPGRSELDDTIDRPACELLVAQLEAYYDVARATFVDNVISLGIEHCLLDGLDTIFCSSLLHDLSDDEVDLLGTEFPEDALRRKTLIRNLEKLKAGRDVCRKYDCPSDGSQGQPAPPQQKGQSDPDLVLQPEPQENPSLFTVNMQGPPSTPQAKFDGILRPATRNSEIETPSSSSQVSYRSQYSRRSGSPSSSFTTPEKAFQLKTGDDDSDQL